MYNQDQYNNQLKELLNEFKNWKEPNQNWRLIIYDGKNDNHFERYSTTKIDSYDNLKLIYDKFLDYYGENIYNYDYDDDLLFCSEYDFIVIESSDNEIYVCKGDHFYLYDLDVPNLELNGISFRTLIYNLQ